jgi:hypothetical protein
MMDGYGKSDSSVVPEIPPNKAAKGVEGRGLAKGNLPERKASRTRSRSGAPGALERARQAAIKDRKQRFEAERFLAELGERLAKFGLELHPDKTRLIEFGRFAAPNRETVDGVRLKD